MTALSHKEMLVRAKEILGSSRDWDDADILAQMERRGPAIERRVAFHEAAHVVLARSLNLMDPRELEGDDDPEDDRGWASIIPGKEWDGHCRGGGNWIARTYRPDRRRMHYSQTAGRDAYENQQWDVSSHARIMMLAAGQEAEIALCGADPNGRFGDQDDREQIEKIAAETWKTTRVDRLRQAARHLVIRHRSPIEAVAERLLEVGTLRGAEIDEITKTDGG